MGSSLRVTPAADAPELCASTGGKLVIVNLQKTPLDRPAALVIHALCDTVSQGLADRLSLTVPPFRLCRRVRVGLKEEGGGHIAEVSGLGLDDTPFALVTRIWARVAGDAKRTIASSNIFPVIARASSVRRSEGLPHEAWRVKLPAGAVARKAPATVAATSVASAESEAVGAAASRLELVCAFSGFYGEPLARISVDLVRGASRTVDLTLTLGEAQWEGGDGAVDPRFAGWGSDSDDKAARPAAARSSLASPASGAGAGAAGARLAAAAAGGSASTARRPRA